MIIRESASVAGVVTISMNEALPRPHVGLVGAIHGDEGCGVQVLQRLQAQAEAGELPLVSGTLVLIHGNPKATGEHARHSASGADLNRLFDFAFESALDPACWNAEHHRAHALGPILRDLDVMLDIHSASSPTPPFVIVNDVPASLDLASRIGFDFISYGWSSLGPLIDKVTVGVLERLGRPGISVECGQHDDPRSIEAAWECAQLYLRATGLLAGDAPEGEQLTYLKMKQIVGRPSASAKFARPVAGLEYVEAGTVLVQDRCMEMTLKESSHVVLPNDCVQAGGDMAYLADATPRP